MTSASDALQEHWRSPIYTFFKSDVIYQVHNGWPSHIFTCAAPKCKGAGGVRRYQDLKDKSSTANLKHHALRCFGADAVNAAIAGKEHANHRGGILAFFARQGKQPVSYTLPRILVEFTSSPYFIHGVHLQSTISPPPVLL